METKYLVNLGAGLIPLLVGAIWYNSNVFGRWLKADTAVTDENAKKGHSPLVYLLTVAGGYYIASSLGSIVIHQRGLLSMLADQQDLHIAGSALNTTAQGLLDKYGDHFRTFKHGAYHGFYTGLYFALPIFGIIALFENKKWSYIAIHAGYWIVCLMLMGGIVCQFMPPVAISIAK